MKMGYENKARNALKEVYNSKKYLFITISVALVLFLFNILVNNYRILFSNFSFSLFFSLIQGTLASITILSIIILIVMSILAGIVVAMTIYLIRRQIKGSFKTSSSSVLVSLIVPTCSSCAMGFLSLLGIGGFLTVLPFKGLELGFLGIGLLGISVVYLLNKIVTKTCSITSQKNLTIENNTASLKK